MVHIKSSVTGWAIEPKFQINLKPSEKEKLIEIQQFFNGAGTIYNKKNAICYNIGSKKDLKILIDHLDKYPLLTQKKADFI